MLKLNIECYGNDCPKLMEDIKAAFGNKAYSPRSFERRRAIMIKDDYTLQLFCEENGVEFTEEYQIQSSKMIYTMRRLNEAFKSIRFANALDVDIFSFNIMVRGMLEELKRHENKEIGD